MEYTIGLASGVPTTFISVGSDTSDGDLDGFLDLVDLLLDETAPPQVFTTSYGGLETSWSRPITKYVLLSSVSCAKVLRSPLVLYAMLTHNWEHEASRSSFHLETVVLGVCSANFATQSSALCSPATVPCESEMFIYYALSLIDMRRQCHKRRCNLVN